MKAGAVDTAADPVLDPPMQGLAESLQRYVLFREANPHFPLFFGAGNVTELMDADTQGVNALLAALAAELGAAMLFCRMNWAMDEARRRLNPSAAAISLGEASRMAVVPPKCNSARTSPPARPRHPLLPRGRGSPRRRQRRIDPYFADTRKKRLTSI